MSPAQSLHLIAAAEEGGHHVVHELPFPPIMFGVFGMLAFLLMLGFLWAFRNTLALDPHGVADAHHDPDLGRSQH